MCTVRCPLCGIRQKRQRKLQLGCRRTCNDARLRVNITTKAGGESLQPVILQIQQMATNILDVIFPYVLKDITFRCV